MAYATTVITQQQLDELIEDPFYRNEKEFCYSPINWDEEFVVITKQENKTTLERIKRDDDINTSNTQDCPEIQENQVIDSIDDDMERFIQRKGIEYIDKYEWDSFEQESIAYSAFVSGCNLRCVCDKHPTYFDTDNKPRCKNCNTRSWVAR